MASAVSASRPDVSARADDPFGYDAAVDDFLRDLPIHPESNNRNATRDGNPSDIDARNVDQEVIVRKKRRPIPKLDEDLLLSNKGIPQLRRVAKKIKFKGKGHEFSDMQRLLTMYQLWFDDMYPRAKFRDAIKMTEKAGHSNRLQVMRKSWIDDTKPRADSPGPVEDEEIVETMQARPNNETEQESRTASTEEGTISPQDNEDIPLDDELDGLLAENDVAQPTAPSSKAAKPRGPFEEDEEDFDDDLDALLAEKPSMPNGVAAQTHTEDVHNSFADEEEAMAGLDW